MIWNRWVHRLIEAPEERMATEKNRWVRRFNSAKTTEWRLKRIDCSLDLIRVFECSFELIDSLSSNEQSMDCSNKQRLKRINEFERIDCSFELKESMSSKEQSIFVIDGSLIQRRPKKATRWLGLRIFITAAAVINICRRYKYL